MNYSDSFVNAVKKEYPTWEALHEHLDAGSITVGRFIDDIRHFNMSPMQIVNHFKRGEEHNVEIAATVAVRREKLYATWCVLYQEELKLLNGAKP